MKPDDANHDRIVELCSAKNAMEAYFFRNLLEDEGIRSRVVGELLDSAAGALPLGEATSPRIWVREEDAAHAREIIDQWMHQPNHASNAKIECNDSIESGTELNEDIRPRTSFVRFRILGRCLVVIGFICIACGVVWAMLNWTLMCRYPEMTRGVLVGYTIHSNAPNPPPPDIPPGRGLVSGDLIYKARYAYVVKGVTYYTEDADYGQLLPDMTIHYDPKNPATNIAGSLTPPGMILFWTFGIGGFALLIGFLMRSFWHKNRYSAHVA
jgi:hypothetical protein